MANRAHTREISEGQMASIRTDQSRQRALRHGDVVREETSAAISLRQSGGDCFLGKRLSIQSSRISPPCAAVYGWPPARAQRSAAHEPALCRGKLAHDY